MSKNIITFWGVRGSIPTSGPQYHKYGGRTSCVSVQQSNRSEVIIFDAGTGIIDLGEQIMKDNIKQGHLFLSHLHMDHVVGLPMFRPLHCSDFELTIYSEDQDIESFFEQVLFNPKLFPIRWQNLPAKIKIEPVIKGQDMNIAGIWIRSIGLNHPGGAVGYRCHLGDRTVCYMTDNEHDDGAHDQNLVQFIKQSDCVIFDATYHSQDYITKKGWGHSSNVQVARLAQAAGIKQLVLYHHCHQYDDATIDGLVIEARSIFSKTVAAFEKMVITL